MSTQQYIFFYNIQEKRGHISCVSVSFASKHPLFASCAVFSLVYGLMAGTHLAMNFWQNTSILYQLDYSSMM